MTPCENPTPEKSMDRKVVAVSGAVIAGVAGLLGGGLLWRWWRARHCNGDNVSDDDWTEEMVDAWIGYHYATPAEYVAFPCVHKDSFDFPVKCAQLCKRHKNDAIISRALDIGCATGRVSFELAAVFHEVIGIDVATLCIDKANQLKQTGRLSYKLTLEGKIEEEYEAVINPDIDKNRVKFLVGDACALPNDLGQFGLVVICNTLCHLPDPLLFLEHMRECIVPGGIFVIVDFYGWDEMFKLPKDRWIAGYKNEDGENVQGFDGLKKVLSPDFILLEEENIQALVRFSYRFYSLQVSHATVWMKKEID